MRRGAYLLPGGGMAVPGSAMLSFSVVHRLSGTTPPAFRREPSHDETLV